jgi:hypothetical protein
MSLATYFVGLAAARTFSCEIVFGHHVFPLSLIPAQPGSTAQRGPIRSAFRGQNLYGDEKLGAPVRELAKGGHTPLLKSRCIFAQGDRFLDVQRILRPAPGLRVLFS